MTPPLSEANPLRLRAIEFMLTDMGFEIPASLRRRQDLLAQAILGAKAG